MSDTNIIILNVLREYIQKVKEEKLFMKNKNHFTVDDSKLNFDRLVSLILNLPKKSLSIELEEFFNSIGSADLLCTKSAFTQQRSKLDYNFFASLSSLLADAYYTQKATTIKKWKGFILCAVDGSTITLINKPDVVEYFGVQTNQHVAIPMGRIMGIYDVLNNVSIACNLFPITISEQAIIKRFTDAFQPNHLFLYDRGFPGFVNIFLHQNQEQAIPFVMRCKLNMNESVTEFVKSKSRSAVLVFKADQCHVDELNNFGYKIKIGSELKVRAVKVKLKNGELEVLLTNLVDETKYPIKIFKDLYFKRWGIETNYNVQKNYLQIECFSGTKVNSIHQDFYANIFVGNLQAILSQNSQQEISKATKHRKYNYQLNRNIAIGLMKNKIPKLFLDKNPREALEELMKQQAQYYEPIRKGRWFTRKRRAKKLSGKYQTVNNYKRAL